MIQKVRCLRSTMCLVLHQSIGWTRARSRWILREIGTRQDKALILRGKVLSSNMVDSSHYNLDHQRLELRKICSNSNSEKSLHIQEPAVQEVAILDCQMIRNQTHPQIPSTEFSWPLESRNSLARSLMRTYLYLTMAKQTPNLLQGRSLAFISRTSPFRQT